MSPARSRLPAEVTESALFSFVCSTIAFSALDRYCTEEVTMNLQRQIKIQNDVTEL